MADRAARQNSIAAFSPVSVREVGMRGPARLARSPCFGLWLLEQGGGTLQVDHAEHALQTPALLCLNPYQRLVLPTKTRARGRVLQFHANFFCLETHHHAVGCNGVLFNEVYEAPLVALDSEGAAELARLMREIQNELARKEVASVEMLLCHLKILLIKATRLKLDQQGEQGLEATKRPEILRRLRELVEAHYTTIHSPTEYARRLGVSTKTLAPLVKAHFHKTVSDLVRDRIIKHARWELLHTLKRVKEIAHEVGFEDEFYFSRMFKRALGRAPLVYREEETALRGGANLSMESGRASIPPGVSGS